MTPWIAHLYTGLGAVAALLAMLAVIDGEYRTAFLWLGSQIFIDATDGLLARALRVKERLPWFDGARLDDIIDYLCYTFIPVLLALHAGLLRGSAGVAVGAFVLLASAYGFSQTAAKLKTTDYFFTGFPSYWNLVVWYLYLFQFAPAVNAVILFTFAILVFVPIRYVYPSRTTTLSGVTNALGVLWAILTLWLLWRLPSVEVIWACVSMIFPIYYFVLSGYLHARDMGASGAPGGTQRTQRT
jgi:phosphatidylcholine synthase